MHFKRDVETNSVSLRIRKSFTNASITAHTVLTDDVFTYVDFFFKTHKKIIKDGNSARVKQDYSFYWSQARNFYNAANLLPIESSPLPMYYSMLNAIKAYLLYYTTDYASIANDFKGHGLKEAECEGDDLSNIYVQRNKWGVFCRFAKTLDVCFDTKWINGDDGKQSIKKLLYQLPFIHAAYISTYSLPRKMERFIPLKRGTSPTFKYGSDRKIHLVVDIDKGYFKQDAVSIPDDIMRTISDDFEINPDNGFQLISKDCFKKSEITNVYSKYRKYFSYIKANNRLWYYHRNPVSAEDMPNINTMTATVAIVHRFSEIVRYKPEQMVALLEGKENWLIHEFLSLALDQFMDEIACEITKQEIMSTRTK